MGGNTPLGLQRLDDGLTFLDRVVNFGHGGGDDDIAAVSRVILSAWRMGTPDVTKVPSVRLKREMELFRSRSPKSGVWSLILSSMARPPALPEINL